MKGGIDTMQPQPMPRSLDKLSVYIPQKYEQHNLLERLREMGKRRDRSPNYLIVEAILQYLEREENKS